MVEVPCGKALMYWTYGCYLLSYRAFNSIILTASRALHNVRYNTGYDLRNSDREPVRQQLCASQVTETHGC